MTNAKDLTKVSPRSPRTRLNGFAILARAIDKGRAELAGTVGDYHFNCPLDQSLFEFKGVQGEDIKKLLSENASDEEVAEWLDAHGTKKSEEEKSEWSRGEENNRPFDDSERKEWFAEQCRSIGLDPAKSTLFDWLEADDKACHPAA